LSPSLFSYFMKKFFLFLGFGFLLLILFSCGGGGSSSGGGSDAGTPSISDLSFYPNSAKVGQGGGSVQVNASFKFIDNGGDLANITVFYYDSNGNTVLNGPYPLINVSGKTTATLYAYINIDTTKKMVWSGGVYVTDTGGRESNRLWGTFTVN
jgi:hypothetical protein